MRECKLGHLAAKVGHNAFGGLGADVGQLLEQVGIATLDGQRNLVERPDQALQRLNHSLQVDPSYDWTYALLGDYYINSLNQVSDPQQKQEILVKAAGLYEKAIPLVKYYEAQNLYSYYLSLGSVSAQLNRINQAIDAYTKALPLLPQQTDRWSVEETIARLYLQKGDVANAMVHAQNAYDQAPSDQKSRLQTLISQIQG